MPDVKTKTVTIPAGQTPGSQHTLEATFAADVVTYSVVVTAGPNGAIAPPSGDFPVDQDTVFTVTADTGFHIDTIKLDGVTVDLTTP